MSKDEWEYLLWKRDNAANLTKCFVHIYYNGFHHETLIIAPDDYDFAANPLKDSYTMDEIDSLGLACLPPTNQRREFDAIEDLVGGCYWTSTYNYTEDKAYYLLFNTGDKTFTMNLREICWGHALRLVSLDK